MAVLLQDVEVTKQLAHRKLVSQKIKALVKQLAKKDELLYQFRSGYANDAKVIALKRKYNVFLAESLLKREAVEYLQRRNNINNDLDSEPGDSKKQADNCTTEIDNIFTYDLSLSVGTNVKR